MRGQVRPDPNNPDRYLWRVIDGERTMVLAAGVEQTRAEAEAAALYAARALFVEWADVDLAPAPNLYRESRP